MARKKKATSEDIGAELPVTKVAKRRKAVVVAEDTNFAIAHEAPAPNIDGFKNHPSYR